MKIPRHKTLYTIWTWAVLTGIVITGLKNKWLAVWLPVFAVMGIAGLAYRICWDKYKDDRPPCELAYRVYALLTWAFIAGALWMVLTEEG